jgi:hypothetical protein
MSARKPKSTCVGKGLTKAPRLQLDSLVRVRREMTKLYSEGKHGLRDVGDVSKLANVLSLIGRLLSEHEFEQRLEALERAAGEQGRQL